MRKKKIYVLGMFPYPSGEGLHVGHVRIFTACDVMARYFRMKNASTPLRASASEGSTKEPAVLSPMGWDAFGLPAENAAIKAKKIPQEMVPKNYANFKKQMQNLSLDFDWERELATTDPSYYAITQWIFLQLYKKGLVYREKVAINWCPKCLTGLANEEVLADGTHERCGSLVGKKLLPQWVMKITDYAERLLNDLDKEKLDWPKGILEMQRNWIGKKEGVVTTHMVEGMNEKLETFSAFPAWLFADTFIAIAPEHPLVTKLVSGTEDEKKVKAFVEEAGAITLEQRTADKFEKKGIFTGRYALDPLHEGRRMPIWVANFAMMGFGTGVIRCSGHDPRDWEFAQKYQIPVNEVVERIEPNHPVSAHGNTGVLKNSGPFSGRVIDQTLIKEMVDWLVKQGHTRRETTWHLRDWVFSRQRYWGEPIPLVYCEKCGDENGVVSVPESQLPLELPTLESYEPTDNGESPLSRVTDWVNTTCPNCGGPAKRETDTMPNWAGSCWYFIAFAFWGNANGENSTNQAPIIKQIQKYKNQKTDKPYTDWWMSEALPKIKEWLPVDWYLGGAEHAVLHLLYARFWVKVLQDLGLLDFPEPFLRLRSVGLVLAEDGKKMSKSLGNVVNPDDMVSKYGSDAVRMYEMFMGPWEQAIAWDSGAISGQVRFLKKVRDLVRDEHLHGKKQMGIARFISEFHQLIKKVGEHIVDLKFNVAIANMMEFVNHWKQNKDNDLMTDGNIQKFLKLFSLFAPTTAQDLWFEIGAEGRVSDAHWPDHDEAYVKGRTVIAVQVNGKLRDTFGVLPEPGQDREYVVSKAMASEKVKKWVVGNPKRVIFVPGKLVNLVV